MHPSASEGDGARGEECAGAVGCGGGGVRAGGDVGDAEDRGTAGYDRVDGVDVALAEGRGGSRIGGRGRGREEEEEEAEAGRGDGGGGARVERVDAIVLVEHVREVLVAGNGDEGVEVLRHQLVLDHLAPPEHRLNPLPELCKHTASSFAARIKQAVRG